MVVAKDDPDANTAPRPQAPTSGAASSPPSDRDTLRNARNRWFVVSAVLAAAGLWGILAWSFGLPVGGEIRTDPFDAHPWRLTNVGVLLATTLPHPALSRMPVVPAGTAGMLSRRPLPFEFVNAPDQAFAKFIGRASPAGAKASSLFDWMPGGPVGSAKAQSKLDLPREPLNQKQAPNPAAQKAPLPQPQQQQQPEQAPRQQPQQQTAPKQDQSETARQPSAEDRERLVLAMRIATDSPILAVNGTGDEVLTDDAGRIRERNTNEPASLGSRLYVSDNSTWYFFADRFGAPAVAAQFGTRIAFGPTVTRPQSGGRDDPRIPSDVIASTAKRLGPGSGGLTSDVLFALFVGGQSGGARVAWAGGLDGLMFTLAVPNGQLHEQARREANLDQPTVRSIFFQDGQVGWASSGWHDGNDEGTERPLVLQTLDGGRTWERLPYRWFPAPWAFVALLAGVGAFARGTRAHYAATQIATKPRIAEHGVSDDPIGLDDADVLGLRPIARALSGFLRNVETKPTVTIGVTGPWGSGKSSLMNVVREDLDDRGVRTVWFNAWHHQKEDSLLAALLVTIREQAVPALWSQSGLRFRAAIFLNRVRRDVAGTLLLFAVLAALLWLLGRAGTGPLDLLKSLAEQVRTIFAPKTGAGDLLEDLIKAVGTSGGLLGVLYGAFRLLLLFKPIRVDPAQLLASISEQASNKDLQQQLAFRHRFAEEFRTFCQTLRSPPHPGLVIFVDDLDRCGSRQTVDVLEAINFVTSAGPCFVVIGFDEDKVRAAIADVYKDTLLNVGSKEDGKVEKPAKEELRRFAGSYLEKLVHLVVPVPRSDEDAVEKLLGLKEVERPSGYNRHWRRRRRIAGEAMASALLGALALLLVMAAGNYVYERRVAVATVTPPVVASTASNIAADTAVMPVVVPPTVAAVDPDAPSLIEPRALIAWPVGIVLPIVLVLLVLAALRYLPRLFAEPVVSDSADFRAALAIWAAAVTHERTTPRAVKRFVNRLRFLAMRVRDVERFPLENAGLTSIDEPLLVTYAAIEDVGRETLEQVAQHLELKRKSDAGVKLGPLVGADLVVDGLKRFAQVFHHEALANGPAIKAYRTISGLVEERGEEAPGVAR